MFVFSREGKGRGEENSTVIAGSWNAVAQHNITLSPKAERPRNDSELQYLVHYRNLHTELQYLDYTPTGGWKVASIPQSPSIVLISTLSSLYILPKYFGQ